MQTARYQPTDVILALAQLTKSTDDDLAALREQQVLLQQDLADAQARGDDEATIDLAGRLAGVQSSLEALAEATDDLKAKTRSEQ